MYMFIQGRCGRTLGFSPFGWPHKGGGVSDACVSVSTYHPSHPVPQEPAAPCPLVSAHTPHISWGNSQLTFAMFPITLEEGARFSQALSLAIVHPSGSDQRDAALYRRSPRRRQLIMSLLFTP